MVYIQNTLMNRLFSRLSCIVNVWIKFNGAIIYEGGEIVLVG